MGPNSPSVIQLRSLREFVSEPRTQPRLLDAQMPLMPSYYCVSSQITVTEMKKDAKYTAAQLCDPSKPHSELQDSESP